MFSQNPPHFLQNGFQPINQQSILPSNQNRHNQPQQNNLADTNQTNELIIKPHSNNQIFKKMTYLIIIASIIFCALFLYTIINANTDSWSATNTLFSISSSQLIYDLVKLNSSSALCLDGSPASYYISRDGDPSKILIFFNGGAWCGDSDDQKTLQSCYQRSKTYLGSSNFNTPTVKSEKGILARQENDKFKDYKKIMFSYCDGSGHQGTRKQPVKYKDAMLYFRGHNITTQKFEDLQKRFGLFSKASQIVLSGDSAGGLAAYTWANYLGQRIQKGKYYVIPDAGIFYDGMDKNTKTYAYKNRFANLMKYSNAQIDPPVPECIKDFPEQKENCMLAQNFIKYIKYPLFPIQSVYDSWSIQYILGINCINNGGIGACSQQDRVLMQDHRRNVTDILWQIVYNNKNGAWGISCLKHCSLNGDSYFDKNLQVPHNSNNTAGNSIKHWVEKPTDYNIFIDTGAWPVNKPCS